VRRFIHVIQPRSRTQNYHSITLSIGSRLCSEKKSAICRSVNPLKGLTFRLYFMPNSLLISRCKSNPFAAATGWANPHVPFQQRFHVRLTKNTVKGTRTTDTSSLAFKIRYTLVLGWEQQGKIILISLPRQRARPRWRHCSPTR
jgi:hypothetical protein